MGVPVEPTKLGVPARVNPYSVIDITPFQEDQPPPPDPEAEEESVSPHVPSGYLVPVPCGYAVPSNLPALLPAYSSPVIVRAVSLDEEGTCPPQALGAGPQDGNIVEGSQSSSFGDLEAESDLALAHPCPPPGAPKPCLGASIMSYSKQ